jgi:hypothetical protein
MPVCHCKAAAPCVLVGKIFVFLLSLLSNNNYLYMRGVAFVNGLDIY